MNDIAMFRIELDAVHQQVNQAIIVEAELMFADMQGQFEGITYRNIDALVEFRSVSSRQFRINWPNKSVHEYIALIFDENHSCLTNIMIHSTLVDLTFTPKSGLSIEQAVARFLFPSPTDKAKPKPYVGMLETDTVSTLTLKPQIAHLSSYGGSIRCY